MSLWEWLLLVAILATVGGVAHYFWQDNESARTAPAPPAMSGLPAEAPLSEPEKPEIRHPVPTPEVEEKPLPTLDQSDALIGDLVAGLVGQKLFASLVGSERLIRRIVATVDNLPRRVAPVRMRAVKPVPGPFAPGVKNRLRYEPLVKVFASLDASMLVHEYVKLYPLFQSAYVELGHPDGYFNDRLVEAIDDLLAAPELKSPPELVQPKVLYLYADSALEGRSAGQKFLLRLGGDNAAKVKAKLREIRRELTARHLKDE